jgi:hypothetical protein
MSMHINPRRKSMSHLRAVIQWALLPWYARATRLVRAEKNFAAARNFFRRAPMTSHQPEHARAASRDRGGMSMLRLTPLLSLLALLGCAPISEAVPRPVDAGVADLAAPSSPDHAPVPTKMTAMLTAAGLDPSHLPPLADVDARQLDAVMATFTSALGLRCADCHEHDFAVETPRKRVARQMWDRWARGLRFHDGGPVYCDSCHQGASTFLDRSDVGEHGALADWMQASYVDPLARADGAAHGCATCHGAPFVPRFLDAWAASDGPPEETPDGGDPTPPPDLGGAGCEALLVCLDGCQDDATCTTACKAHANARAKKLLRAAQRCANQDCLKAGRCASASDDSADCNQCYSNASSGGVTGVACVPPNDPSCGHCAAQWHACEVD